MRAIIGLNLADEIKKNKYRCIKGTSFLEFYYTCLFFEKKAELKTFLTKNKWYYDKVLEEVQNSIKKHYEQLK